MGKKKSPLKPATESSRYKKFIAERDRALEVLLNNARAQMHDALRGSFQAVKEKIALKLAQGPKHSMAYSSAGFLDGIDSDIKNEFAKTANLIAALFVRLKMTSYTLAYVGEAEAIGRAKDKPAKVNLERDTVIEQAVTDFHGNNIASRINYAFDKLRRRIIDAVQLSRVNEDSIQATLERVDRALPGGRWVKRPKRALKPLKEAGPIFQDKELEDIGDSRATRILSTAEGAPVDMVVGFIDDETWSEMTSDYLKKYVPTYAFRGPDPDADYAYERFDTQKDMTNNFVKTVKDAAKDASKFNGVTDFVWISILDGLTDECCEWRDGLTTTEIEEALKGEHSDDKCNATSPPAHFNCRCTLAPMLRDMPELPESNAKEFDEWLNS